MNLSSKNQLSNKPTFEGAPSMHTHGGTRRFQESAFLIGVIMKQCTRCEVLKPESEFSKDKTATDGLNWRCKDCNRELAKVWWAANPERAKANSRAWKAANPEKARAYNKAWNTANKERVNRNSHERRLKNYGHYRMLENARSKVACAVKSGELGKSPCERCGAVKVLAHHEDYSKPLDINWFCPQCHVDRHQEINAAQSIT